LKERKSKTAGNGWKATQEAKATRRVEPGGIPPLRGPGPKDFLESRCTAMRIKIGNASC